MHLTADQLQHIENFIDDSGINYSHLKADLLDHMCCDIEQQMDTGKSFQTAFEQVLFNCSMSHLAHLQKQTLLLTNKVYAFMKKIIHLFGVVVPILITVGAMGKAHYWPFASVALILGFVFLNFMLIPAITVVSYTEFNERKFYGPHLSGASSLIVLLSGLLFKIMHWPGANILQLAGLLSVLIAVPVFWLGFRRHLKDVAPILLTVLSITVLVVGVIMKLFHWPGAIFVIITSLIVLNSVLLPGFFRSSHSAPAKSILAVVVAVWLSIGGLTSYYKFAHSAKDYYTHQSALVQMANTGYEGILQNLATDSIEGVKITNYLSAYHNLNRFLQSNINTHTRVEPVDPDFRALYDRYSNHCNALVSEEIGNMDTELPRIPEPFSEILLCKQLELYHQQMLIHGITHLKMQ